MLDKKSGETTIIREVEVRTILEEKDENTALLPYILVCLIIILGVCIAMVIFVVLRSRRKNNSVKVLEDERYSQKALAVLAQSERQSFDRYPYPDLPMVIH